MAKQNNYSLSNNVFRTLKIHWQLDRAGLISYLLLAGLQVVSGILTVFFTSRIVGDLTLIIQGQPAEDTSVYLWLGLSVAALFAERFAWRWLYFIDRKTWIRWYSSNTYSFNSAVSRLSMEQHHDAEFQKVLAKLQQEYEYTPQNYAQSIIQLVHSTARLFSSLAVAVTFAPWLVILMAVSLIPGFFTEKRLSKLLWNLWGEKGDKNLLAYRTTLFLQDKNKLQESFIFGTRQHLLNIVKKLYGSFYEEQINRADSIKPRAFASLLSEIAVIAFANFWLIRQVVNGTLSLANFTFYNGILLQFGGSLQLIVRSLSELYDKNEFMRDLYKLYDTEPSLKTPAEPVIVGNEIPVIEFKDVWFKYPGSREYSLKSVNLVIRPGEKIAFVGANGAGKTTLIKLLLRFYDCTKGQVLINGNDIKQIDLPSLYNHIGVLFQNFNDYPYSVRDNIALGRVENFHDDKRVYSAARQADADSIIKKYPKGYDQVLEISFKDGVEPSGGQWQRIALARALFRDAGILILDEPTAAVDAKSEYAIFKTLEDHSQNKTTIVISHRFSTVRTAEQIYVIEDGHITESGSHDQLMKLKTGTYREMFEKQAAGYR